MARYRKRPVVVEAEQWFPGKGVRGVFPAVDGTGESSYVVTIHGQLAFLSPGDWVITEPDGKHHYPCKDAIFRAVYEPVEGD